MTNVKAATDFVEEWFDLSRDLQPFYTLAEDDEILDGVVSAYKGLRIIAVEDLFEALCWSIMGQQISLHVAYALKQKLVTTYGESIVHEDERVLAISFTRENCFSYSRRFAQSFLYSTKSRIYHWCC